MPYRVERKDYSSCPWRVLDADTGDQVWQERLLDHPEMGRVVVPGPVCFDRKRDAVAWVQSRDVGPDA